MNSYVYIDGYKLKEDSLNYSTILDNLIKSEQGICAIDNNNNIYICGNIDNIKNENNLDLKVFINSVDILNEEQKNNLSLLCDNIYSEQFFLNSFDKFLKFKMNDIYIKYKDISCELHVSIYLNIYSNSLFNFVFKIDYPNKIDSCNLEHCLRNQKLDYYKIPSQYLLFTNSDWIPKENELKTVKDNIFIDELFNSFSNLLLKDNELFLNYTRTSIFLNNKSISKENVMKLLYQNKFKFKKNIEIKDYRIIDDYYHYSNKLHSVIYGKEAIKSYNLIVLLDIIIINKVLYDLFIYNNINEDLYSLKELYRIQEDYERESAFYHYFPFVEENNYIEDILKQVNNSNINSIINSSIERKINEKNNYVDHFYSCIGCLLASPVLYDYFIEPIIIWYFNYFNHTNINSISSPWNYLINILVFIFCYKYIKNIILKIINNK